MKRPDRAPLNHADKVRERRATRSTQREKRAADQYRRPASFNAPVITRSGMGGVPIRQKAAGKARKQYYYALSTPGAEVRLPAIPTIQIGWRWFSFLLIVLMTGCLYILWKLPMFQVTQPKITGAQRLAVSDIEAVLGIDKVSVVEVAPLKLEADLLQAFPDIAKADVEVSPPNQVTVTIVERKPLISWEQNGKNPLWIDQNGTVFAPRGDAQNLIVVKANADPPAPPAPAPVGDATPTPTPVVKPASLAPTSQMDPQLIPVLEFLQTKLPVGVSLAYHSHYGFGWIDPRGWEVYFGRNTDQIDQKLQEYEAIVDQLTREGVKIDWISMEFLNAPYYHPR